MANQKEKLFQDFPPVSTQEWMDKITVDLKGADFEKKLVWKTNEGIKVNPFYRDEDLKGMKSTESLPGQFPFVRGTSKDNDWYVRQDIVVSNIVEANTKALDLLNKGITSLAFYINSADVSKENIEKLLKDVVLDAVELNFSTCIKKTSDLVEILVNFYKNSSFDLLKCYGSVDFDPFKVVTKKGMSNDAWVQQSADIVKKAASLPRFRVLSVNAYKLSDGGAYSYQELGLALANGNEILSKLIETGLDVTLVAKKIKFNFGVSSNYFMEIAKFRAARWLWALIVDQYKPNCNNDCPTKTNEKECKCACKIYTHAQTSNFNKTVFDPYVNLLRSQTEAMSATLAGVNSLTVLPFDTTYQKSDEFSERIARNQQLLLKEEAHFDKITDISSGSYYIEHLTTALAEQAWKLFLEIDKNGYYAALKANTVQNTVKAAADSRFKAVATRKEVLLGTNQYPNFTETMSSKITIPAHNCGCEKGELETLPTTRLSEQFEILRLSTEKAAKKPKAFMLTIGSLSMRLARSQFSCNFFGCAGYEVIDNLGFQTVQEGVAVARNLGAEIIVLCSSDDEYAELAPAAYELVKGKELFVVAGAPACADDLKAKGIENFINVRTNVLETLQSFNKKLGIN